MPYTLKPGIFRPLFSTHASRNFGSRKQLDCFLGSFYSELANTRQPKPHLLVFVEQRSRILYCNRTAKPYRLTNGTRSYCQKYLKFVFDCAFFREKRVHVSWYFEVLNKYITLILFEKTFNARALTTSFFEINSSYFWPFLVKTEIVEEHCLS